LTAHRFDGHAVRTLIDGGNAVIFDHVLHDSEMYESCRRAFNGLNVFTVGVICPVEVLGKRERARGDRVTGRARGLVGVVHRFCEYDVMVNTGTASAAECVLEILAGISADLPIGEIGRQDRH